MAAKKKSIAKKLRPVVVCTAHRGVFFGYADDTSGTCVKLKNGRMCVYWEAALKGVVGLASDGPGPKCKIGPAADMDIRAVTAVIEATDSAAAKWESAPWA